MVIQQMTDVLQHGNWSGLGPNNRFVRLDNIFSKILFPMDFSRRAQMRLTIRLEIVFTRAAPAFDNLFMGCAFNINTVHKTVEN